MMTIPVSIYGGAANKIMTGGVSVIAAYGGLLGGVIQNPASPQDQGIFLKVAVQNFGALALHGPLNTYALNTTALNSRYTTQRQYITYNNVPTTESLFVDLVGSASLGVTQTTIELFPGDSFNIPAGQSHDVSVNAATSGHKFSVFIIQVPTIFPPVPIPSTFPPIGPTGLTKTINSYLYQEYQDDDDVQDFVDSYNKITQQYVDTFNNLNLPIYTNPNISGSFLDWLAQGLYGLSRPALSSGKKKTIGPLNTYVMNKLAPNQRKTLTKNDIVVTTDDIFKRILTWHFFKGDGKQFDIRWLKRRIIRFLNGVDGTNIDVSDTSTVSVVFTGRSSVLITISPVGSAAIAVIFQEAVSSGALELPFQYTYTVNVIT